MRCPHTPTMLLPHTHCGVGCSYKDAGHIWIENQARALRDAQAVSMLSLSSLAPLHHDKDVTLLRNAVISRRSNTSKIAHNNNQIPSHGMATAPHSFDHMKRKLFVNLMQDTHERCNGVIRAANQHTHTHTHICSPLSQSLSLSLNCSSAARSQLDSSILHSLLSSIPCEKCMIIVSTYQSLPHEHRST